MSRPPDIAALFGVQVARFYRHFNGHGLDTVSGFIKYPLARALALFRNTTKHLHPDTAPFFRAGGAHLT